MSNTKFGYLKATVGKNKYGYVCIALQIPPKGTKPIDCKAGFSFCSPSDLFNKKIARKIAEGRLYVWKDNYIVKGFNPRLRFTFIPEKEPFSIIDVFIKALAILIFDNTVPKWLLKAAKESNIVFGLSETRSPKIGISLNNTGIVYKVEYK